MLPDLASISGGANLELRAGLWLVSLEPWPTLLAEKEKGEKHTKDPETTHVLGHLPPVTPSAPPLSTIGDNE